jgi:hypothetical protein
VKHVWLLLEAGRNTIVGVYGTHDVAQEARMALKTKVIFGVDHRIEFDDLYVQRADVRMEI